MYESVVRSTVRLTIVGPDGPLDLVVPVWADLRTVSRRYAGRVGVADDMVFTASDGTVLDAHVPIQRLGFRHGELIYTFRQHETHPRGPAQHRGHEQAQGRTTMWPVGLAAISGLTAGVAAATGDNGTVRNISLAVLTIGAFVAALPWRHGSAWPLAAPALAAGATFTLVDTQAVGGLQVAVGAAGFSAVALGAVSRMLNRRRHVEQLIWMVAGGATALTASVCLLLDTSDRAMWAVLFAFALLAARMLPTLVLSVPDQALLDIDRLAVTAWSARDARPKGRRSRSVVDPAGVRDVAVRSRVLVDTGTVAAAFALAVLGPLLMADPGSGSSEVGVRIMVGSAAAALALGARTVRSLAPRAALRLSASVLAIVFGADVVLSTDRLGLIVIVSLIAAAAGVATAIAVGRGWRSLRWGRLADFAEEITAIAAVAALPLATGLFELVRRAPS
ncbi:hypothetical protein [Aeromicrobium sp.]|uniref:hypothetical protein n=1 Tax=Aeromicrobium sp. TaxID=1871063 RepID=UPI0019B6D1F0|nr:hypothetical protein [Aeromicrobium sp.]MBC7630359.1 hypothetical protein [Aeromicrobium sp.]